MKKTNYLKIVQLKQLELDIDNELITYKNNEQLMDQNIVLYRQNTDKLYLDKAKQNLTNMNNNTNKLNQYYYELTNLKSIIYSNDPNKSDIDNTIDKLKLEIENTKKQINELNDTIISIDANLNHSTKKINSTYIQYNVVMLITILLFIIVILSYYFKKDFIHEYIILGLLILYILYYLYNLL